jgi:hypothetical protein
MQGGLPANYTISASTVALNTSVSCTLTGPSSTSALFTATGIS